MTIEKEIKRIFISGLRPENARRKGYLGMSMIGGCPTAAYDSFMGTREVDMRLLWYGFAGGNCESGIRDLFRVSSEFVLIPKEHYMYHIEADFDSRYRGHADIILASRLDGELIVVDVKSLGWDKFEDVALYSKVPYSHEKNVAQVRSYMYHGKFDRGAIIYTPRDIPHGGWPDSALHVADNDVLPFRVFEAKKDSVAIADLNEKATLLLKLIDKRKRPECTCGFCRRDYEEIPF
ncbi:hypothetical protein LCGC14_1346060 [marine sediment metagenome]|uniref:PD-(D/E)XK endonuclease-like domain-containing protein n=1 Tax=marine sediment metagenome TaxID=412755 RepID=A0A0F9KYF6_9ZZZZ